MNSQFLCFFSKKLDKHLKMYGRINDRVLNDYCLQHLKIRGKDHFSFRTMLIGICIHLDAGYDVAVNDIPQSNLPTINGGKSFISTEQRERTRQMMVAKN